MSLSRWMESYGTRKLNQLIMPGAHDAGTAKGHINTTAFGTNSNSATQDKTFWQMLECGVRFFDVRLKTVGKKDAKKVVPNNYYGHYYMVSSQEPKLQQQASWALVSYMLSHGEEYLEKVGIVQPTKALMESAAFKAMPYSDVFAKDMAAGHIVYYGASSSKIDALLREAIESVMVAGVEPQKALEKLRKDVNAVLAQE